MGKQNRKKLFEAAKALIEDEGKVYGGMVVKELRQQHNITENLAYKIYERAVLDILRKRRASVPLKKLLTLEEWADDANYARERSRKAKSPFAKVQLLRTALELSKAQLALMGIPTEVKAVQSDVHVQGSMMHKVEAEPKAITAAYEEVFGKMIAKYKPPPKELSEKKEKD